MRVTHQMIADRTTANLSSAVTRLLQLQIEMSTGRRLNRPSDDPIGVTRDLSYRTTITSVTQYQANISSARTQLNTVEQSLSSVSNLLLSARELATGLADDLYDATARRGAAGEARTLLDQMLQAGNTQLEGRYIFSGHMTRSQSFLATPTGVIYQGDRGVVYSQIETSSQVAINMLGSDMLIGKIQTLGETFDLNRGIDTGVALADLRAGTGIDQAPGIIQITDDNLGVTVAVDLSAATTIGDILNAINTQLTAGGITGVTASVSPTGNAIRLDAMQEGLISNATNLASLNKGSAVDLSPGTFRIATDDGGIDVTIDLSSAQTIGQVITQVNSQLATAGVTNVTLDINATQTGLRLRDTNVMPLGLQVVDAQGESTAHELGLVGYVNSELIGSDLNPERAITVAENGASETTANDLGLLGTFTGILDGQDLDPAITLTTPLSQLDSGHGANLGRIRLRQGDSYRIVDLSTAVTVGDVVDRINNSGLEVQASINSGARGIQVVSTATDKTLIIVEEDAVGGAATLGIKGSPDLLGNMMLLVEALENNDREMIGNMIGGLTRATDLILDSRAVVGANIRRMDATGDRLTDLSLSVTRLLSEVEDADIIKVTTELATQQNLYQAALNAVGRMLTPSLIDFVR